MNLPRFTKINEAFTCAQCGAEVLPTEGDTYRNHCPFCLYSRHVDILPGDRQNSCMGMLQPIAIEIKPKGEIDLIFRCLKCGETTKNKMALKTKVQPDNYDLAVKLSVQERC